LFYFWERGWRLHSIEQAFIEGWLVEDVGELLLDHGIDLDAVEEL